MRVINDNKIKQNRFAFDGCHKFYLIDNPKDERMMRELGYQIYEIDDLPLAWNDSCPLRFIMSANLETTYVSQGEPARFMGWPISSELQASIDELAEMQRDINESSSSSTYVKPRR